MDIPSVGREQQNRRISINRIGSTHLYRTLHASPTGARAPASGVVALKRVEEKRKGKIENNRAAADKNEETESPAVPHSLSQPEDELR